MRRRVSSLPDSITAGQRSLVEDLLDIDRNVRVQDIKINKKTDKDYYLFGLTARLNLTYHSRGSKTIQGLEAGLINELFTVVSEGVESDKELGRALAWLPLVQHRYWIIPPMTKALEKQGKYVAAAALYQGMIKWADRENSGEFIEVMNTCIQFFIRHHNLFPNQLKPMLQFYMAKLNESTADMDGVHESKNNLILYIHQHLQGIEATKLQDIVDDCAANQTAQ